MTRTRRRDHRSTNVPAKSPRSAEGNSSARNTSPTESVPWLSSLAAVHGSASRDTSDPNIETPSPMTRIRSSRCFHAALISEFIWWLSSQQLLLHWNGKAHVDARLANQVAQPFSFGTD